MKTITITLCLCLFFPLICIGQIVTKDSMSKTLTTATLTKDSTVTLQKSQPLVTVKEVDSVGMDGKTTKQKVAENDVGITIQHHWTKYPTEAITTIQVGTRRYMGVSTFDSNGNETLTVKEATLKEGVTK